MRSFNQFVAPAVALSVVLGGTACTAEKPADPQTICVEGPLGKMTAGVPTDAIANVAFTITGLEPDFIIRDKAYKNVQTTGKKIKDEVARKRTPQVIYPSDIISFCVNVLDLNDPKKGGSAWKTGMVIPADSKHPSLSQYKKLPPNTVFTTDEQGNRTGEFLVKRPTR